MSLKERLDKKKKKYLQKLAGGKGSDARRLGDANGSNTPGGENDVSSTEALREGKKLKEEKELWKYEGETNEDGEVHMAHRLQHL